MTDNEIDETGGETVPPITRRELFGAALGVSGGAVAAALGTEAARGDPQGGAGTPSNPYQAAYLDALRGPVVDQGSEITQLVDMRAAETGASITPDTNTLVFRYDPTA